MAGSTPYARTNSCTVCRYQSYSLLQKARFRMSGRWLSPSILIRMSCNAMSLHASVACSLGASTWRSERWYPPPCPRIPIWPSKGLSPSTDTPGLRPTPSPSASPSHVSSVLRQGYPQLLAGSVAPGGGISFGGSVHGVLARLVVRCIPDFSTPPVPWSAFKKISGVRPVERVCPERGKSLASDRLV